MMASAEPSFSDMLDGGCNWRNRSELLGVLMRWSPNTTGGSRFFVTKAEYLVSALDGRDGYGSDAEYLPRRPKSHIQISATGRSRHSRYPGVVHFAPKRPKCCVAAKLCDVPPWSAPTRSISVSSPASAGRHPI